MRIYLIYTPYDLSIMNALEFSKELSVQTYYYPLINPEKTIFWRNKNLGIEVVFQMILAGALGIDTANTKSEFSDGKYFEDWVRDGYYENVFLVVENEMEYKKMSNRFGCNDKHIINYSSKNIQCVLIER